MGWVRVLGADRMQLLLHVQPRASRSRFLGLHGEALKLSLTAPPVDNRANKAVIAFLADFFQLPRSAVEIRSGLKGRKKQVVLSGISEEEVRERLQEAGIDLEV